MELLRWLGGMIVFVWVIGLVLKIGGKLLHLLFIIALIVFLLSFIL
ncbi:DUF5670 family protein [Alkalibaculum sporogenes]|nr:DUF5670 family protein [Alkalibaculum sporogenes]